MSNQSPADIAIAAAAAAAAQQTNQGGAAATPGVSTVPAVQTNGTAVGAPVTPGVALSMDTIGSGQMSVDEWLKVKEDGLKIGEKAGLLTDAIRVVIDMRDGTGFTVKMGIKGGNPAQYAYTFDNVISNTGKPWELECARIRGLQASASPYRCVDLPMVVETAVKLKNETLIEEGKVLGYTTSTTNWSTWEQLYKEVAKAGLMGQKVIVELTAIPKSNKAGNKWGIVGFKLIGAALEEGGE